jgi:Carboxypeptidase regulatory-like domain/Kelch motif/Galactose oxidase, central domain
MKPRSLVLKPFIAAGMSLCLLVLVVLHGSVSAQTNGTFTNTGSLGEAHQSHVAAYLPNGQVLIAGGRDANGVGLSTAELFSPTTGTWSATGNMTYPRSGDAVVTLPSGNVMVIGGTPNNICTGAPVGDSAEIFNPATGAWLLTSSMTEPRNVPAAVLLTNGKVLVAGGGNRCGGVSISAELYDPATNTWIPTGSMNIARQEPASVLLSDGKVLVAGGSGGYPFASLSSAEIYDPASGLWTLTGSMHDARIWDGDDNESGTDGLIRLPNGKVLTIGGYNRPCNTGSGCTAVFLSSAELFDPATGSWTPTGSMGSARASHRTTQLATGNVLVIGGFSGITYLNTAEIYDSLAGAFSPVGNMNETRVAHTATRLADGRVLIAGGISDTIHASAEIFSDVATPPLTSSGHVADANNNPVAGVLIADGAGHTAITDTNGNYTLSGLAAGTYTLTPSSSSYTFAPAARVVSVPPNATAQDFTATPSVSSSISGRVADASNIALAGVTISDGAGHTVTTDVNGNYTIAGLSDGLYTITPSRAGYTFTPATPAVRVPPAVAGLNFIAIPTSVGTSSITGRVTDAANQPLAGVTISDGANHNAATDANGNYTLTSLATGSYTVSASKSGYRFSPPTRVIRVPADATGQNFIAAPISSGGPIGSVKSSITGRIVDNVREAPVSGVTISDGVGHTAVTDANGNYTLADLTAGTYSLTPAKSGYTFTPSARSVKVPPGATGQNFVARPPVVGSFSVSGHVLDNVREAPVSGVTISDGAGHTATTDANGNYTLSGLVARVYTLTPAKAGYTFSPTTRPVSVPPNAIGQNFLAIVNDPGNANISGRITDPNNAGVAGIAISDNAGHTAVTNSAGQYSLTGLPAGLYTITPSKTGYSFTPPSRTIQLQRSASIAGYTFSATPIPVPGLRGSIAGTVSVNGIGPAFGLAGAVVQACRVGASSCITANSGNQGAYTLSNLESGLYSLRAFAAAGFGPTLLPVEIGPISLAASQAITGQNLVFGLPIPVPNGVTFAGAGPGASLPSISRISGPYRLTAKGCASGTATYTIKQGGFILAQNGRMTEGPTGTYTAMVGPLARSYTALPAGRARFDITIQCPGGGNALAFAFDIYIDPSGVVKTVDGNLIVGATVTLFRSDSPDGPFDAIPDGSALMSPSNRHNPTVTDADGSFSWDVVAGFYKLRAEKAGCVSPSDATQPYAESAVLTIPPPVTDLDLRLSCESAPPASSAVISPEPIAGGWNKTDVTVTLRAIDNANGADVKELTYTASGAQPIATTTVGGMSVSIPITAEGETTITYFAADNVDNIEPAHIIIVKLDKTAPQLIITSPQSRKYLHTATFMSNWNVSDTFAQVSSIVGKLDGKKIANGQVIDIFFLSLGKHTITVKASDYAGNRVTASATFRVVADIDSLITAERRVCLLGWINSKAECQSLESKLQRVRSDIHHHRLERAERRLKAILQRLNAQKGKTVNIRAYDLLSGDALYVMHSLVDDD